MRNRALPVLALLAAPLLQGCGVEGPLVVASAASVAVAGKTPVDMAVSWATGQECSVVRLDRRESYCAPLPPPPGPEPICTRSLGAVDCWTAPPRPAAPPAEN